MPRVPTACRIGPSRLALLAHLLPATAVPGLLFFVLSPAPWLALLLLLLAVALRAVRRSPRGELRAEADPSGGVRWRWCAAGDREARPVSLRCDYLGPWLIGLRLDGRRLWIWPDSCTPQAHRELRRWLVRH